MGNIMAGLQFKNIKKCYDNKFVAVNNFNLDIEDGEFIVLVGPSGCGKSTLLRMIAGLEGITEGELYIDNKCVNDVAPSNRDIAMVFQNYALYGNMTVYENMGFSLTVRHNDEDVIHEKVMEASEVVNLKKELNRKPANLSGGQRQRVALGRSIVREAKVFLLDEPLSNLDAKLRNETRNELVSLHNRLETTFIYVTHDQVEAMTMADRMVIMKDGIMQQVGTPNEVYSKPDNMFVAGFIGTPPMNFVEGKILNGHFVSEDISFLLPSVHRSQLSCYENKNIIIGIRPEDIVDTDRLIAMTDTMYSLPVYLDVVELLGADMLLHFTKNGKMMTSSVRSSYNIRRGEEVSLTIKLNHIHYFDPETTLRLNLGGDLCNE
jgi:multiple sugar transport system ATP-binding protein